MNQNGNDVNMSEYAVEITAIDVIMEANELRQDENQASGHQFIHDQAK